ncbi:hypothetical protein B0A55_05629 [Friedmanniomyces simplex]|uniref:C2H2-type domain-containing protein n=1 Tax=Friedmanniomyces simplex TaxID=329884 RepID=A0A4U0XAI8_9PEZI|nr:hypothetical protein B0A55_05629 [Friedmanniomyces simplex]
MGALDSFTARRPNASNLPSFELPPPPLTSFGKYHGHQTTQPNLTSGTVTSFGNLLTPPSNSSADGISPSSGVNSSSLSNNGAVQPYTNGSGPGAQSYGSSRPIFSPSLNSIVRANHSPTASDSLPPPPYEIPQYQTTMSMSAPPLQTAQQQMMGNSMMNGQTPVSASVTQPSPVHSQEAFARPPPTPTYYGGSQASSTPQQANFPYTTGPSSIHQSPISAGGSLHKMSPVNGGGGSMPALGQPPQYPQHRPYSYPLPGPVLSNVNNPGGQLALVGGLPHGMMGGYNSGHAASMHHMYGGHAPPANPQNDRPFRCDQCPQSFNRNHDLKRHKRIHLAVKPFPCGHCDKSFSRKDALKRHVLVKGCGKTGSLVDTKEIDPSVSPKSEGSNTSPLVSTAPA